MCFNHWIRRARSGSSSLERPPGGADRWYSQWTDPGVPLQPWVFTTFFCSQLVEVRDLVHPTGSTRCFNGGIPGDFIAVRTLQGSKGWRLWVGSTVNSKMSMFVTTWCQQKGYTNAMQYWDLLGIHWCKRIYSWVFDGSSFHWPREHPRVHIRLMLTWCLWMGIIAKALPETII